MWVVLSKIAVSLLIVWAAATLGFFALAVLPGDAIESQLVRSGVEPGVIAERRASLGLTDSVIVRYVRFLNDLLRGDLGTSLLTGERVVDAIFRSIGPTFALAGSALIAAVGLGLAGGIVAGLGIPFLSSLARISFNLALSMPIYWTGTVAIYIFSVLPSAGAGRLSQLVLPVLILGFHTSGAIGRVTQVHVRQVLADDFVRTARAKGLPEYRVMLRHVLRVAVLPVISVIALQAGFLLSGTVVTETLFVRPGMGRLLLDAVLQQDYPVVLGVVIFSAGVYTAASFLADLALRLFDPRVSH